MLMIKSPDTWRVLEPFRRTSGRDEFCLPPATVYPIAKVSHEDSLAQALNLIVPAGIKPPHTLSELCNALVAAGAKIRPGLLFKPTLTASTIQTDIYGLVELVEHTSDLIVLVETGAGDQIYIDRSSHETD